MEGALVMPWNLTTKRMKRIFHITVLMLLFVLMSGGMRAIAQSGSKVHVVQEKETLYRIGLRYNVTVAELYRLNPGAREGIKAGQKLILPDNVSTVNASAQTREPKTVFHAVQKGETLYSIARRYDVTVADILSANPDLKSADSVPLGIVLRIPSTGNVVGITNNAGAQAAQQSPVKPTTGAKSLKAVTVPAGATVYSILKNTNWSEKDFYYHNPQVKNGLRAGDKILVPDDYRASTPGARNDGGATSFIPSGRVITVALALPFKNDSGRRFADYYEGFLLMLKDAQEKGVNVDLYTLDCSDDMMPQTLRELQNLPQLDLLIGGVSINAMNDLATVAHRKGAVYVVPFTSKKLTATDLDGLQIYQINTPHESLYEVAAERFVQYYAGRHVHFVRYDGDSSSKEPFVNELKAKLRRAGMSFSESSSSEFSVPGQVERLVQQHGKMVVIPNAGSQIAANNTVTPIANAVDSLGVDMVTAFGYPEWQTYTHSVGPVMRKVNATFYTTFYVNAHDEEYQEFQRDFISWFGHGTGITFPKYSILGYDTGAFFLLPSDEEPVGRGARFNGDRQHQGIQSNFYFRPAYDNRDLHSNLGVFFVRYLPNGRTERF